MIHTVRKLMLFFGFCAFTFLVSAQAPVINSFNVPDVCDGADLNMTADVSGTVTSYEWKLGSTVIGTAPTLAYTASTGDNNKVLTLTVYNGAQSAHRENYLTVYPLPVNPTVNYAVNGYCQGSTVSLSIYGTNPAKWYDVPTGGVGSTTPPVINSSITGTTSYWATQTVAYTSSVSCESHRQQFDIIIIPKSPPPTVSNPNIEVCQYSVPITLSATGVNLKWYYNNTTSTVPPTVSTTTLGTQVFYVTQTITNECESEKTQITVTIQQAASPDVIEIVGDGASICAGTSTTLYALAPSINNPLFRWYNDENKTTLLGTGIVFHTGTLNAGVNYYVTVEYQDVCESRPKSASVHILNNERPTIIAPKEVIVPTDAGVCVATNVNLGTPTVSDDCTPINQLIVTNNALAIYPLGHTLVDWIVQDQGGLRESASQTVTVIDQEFPVVTCPNDTIIIIDEDNSSVIVNYSISFTDNCPGTTITINDPNFASGSSFPLGVSVVRHTIKDASGNTVICEFKVTVQHPWKPINIGFRVSSYEICPNERVTITPVVSGGSGITSRYVYSWTSPIVSSIRVMEDYPLVSSTYTLTVSDGTSSETKSINITVREAEPVKLRYDGGNIDEIYENSEVVVSATAGFPSYKFLLNDKVVRESGMDNKIGFYAELQGKYKVQVFATSVNNCVSQDQLVLEITGEKLPNVFTPNRDGKNELFLPGHDLTVFNRTGTVLYQGKAGWDGTYKGKVLPQGTYLYIVKRPTISGTRTDKGIVTLKL